MKCSVRLILQKSKVANDDDELDKNAENLKNSIIASCIEQDYLKDLMPIYAHTIACAEQHPEQVNNEIRNALTHLARCAHEHRDIGKARIQIEKAQGHFERAKKDCLKISIAILHDRVRETIAEVEYIEGAINSKYKKKFVNLQKKRQSAFEKETIDDTTGCVADLLNIVNDLDDLEEQILTEYTNLNTGVGKIRKLFYTAIKAHEFKAQMLLILTLSGSFLYTFSNFFAASFIEFTKYINSLTL